MRCSNSMRLVAAAAVLMAGGAGAALAQSGGATSVSNLKLSNDKPIQIESDKLEVRQRREPGDLFRQCQRGAGRT